MQKVSKLHTDTAVKKVLSKDSFVTTARFGLKTRWFDQLSGNLKSGVAGMSSLETESVMDFL